MNNAILESYNKMQDVYSPVDQTPESDPMDVVTMDVPLLIRLFELVREDVQDDAQLHDIATNILEVSKQSDGPLTMEDYDQILGNDITPNQPQMNQSD